AQGARGGPGREGEAAPVDGPVEPLLVRGAEAAPEGQVVGPVQDVDRIELEPTRVVDEPDKPSRRQPAGPWPPEVLALEEERRDGPERDDGSRTHAGTSLPCHVRDAGAAARVYLENMREPRVGDG